MFFFYSGSEALQVKVPSEQYTLTIQPSERSQKTSNKALYDYLFSDEFEFKALFQKAVSFEPPKKEAPESLPVKIKGSKQAEGSAE